MDKLPGSHYNKVPYQRSQKHRYEISRDPFSKERIKVISELQKTLSRVFPIPLSITVMGSLLKGKKLDGSEVAENTDIDLFVHIDREEFNSLLNNSNKLDTLTKTLGIETTATDPLLKTKLLGFVYNYIKSGIAMRKDKLGYSEEAKIDIGVDFSDPGSIECAIKDVKVVDRNIQLNPIEAYVTLGSYFLPASGTVAKKYRNQFLLRLFQNPNKEYAQKQWEIVRNVINRLEDVREMPSTLLGRVPFSLGDALRFYRIETAKE